MKPKLGTDLCSLKRIAKIYKQFGEKFLDRILTAKEKESVISSKKLFLYRLAGRYAAKEAVAKALGTGIGKELSFRDIEILRDGNQPPQITLHDKAKTKAEALKLKNWTLSVSHEEDMALAVVMAC